MEAGFNLPRVVRSLGAGLVVAWCVTAGTVQAANYRTRNFLVEAPSPRLAETVGKAAEKYRHDLAVHWLGKPLGPWDSPCPIRVVAGHNLAAQGVTTYDRAPVRNFTMEVVGTPERILDSVLPHEVSHTVLATHFGKPLPRWADEGICTTVEHGSERAKHEAKLREFLRTRRGIPMNQLFLLTEYPSDVLPMYAQGYSVCRFLIQQRGPRTFIGFLQDYMQRPSWTENVHKHYGYESLGELQEYWLAWVANGSGAVDQYAKYDRGASTDEDRLASNEPGAARQPGPPTTGSPAPTRLAAATPSDSFYLRRRDGKPETEPVSPSQGSRPPRNDSGVASTGSPPRAAATAQPDPSNLADAYGGATAAAAQQAAAAPAGSGGGMIPPSVRNSGRYSAAQPQPEQGGPRTEGLSHRRGIPSQSWR